MVNVTAAIFIKNPEDFVDKCGVIKPNPVKKPPELFDV